MILPQGSKWICDNKSLVNIYKQKTLPTDLDKLVALIDNEEERATQEDTAQVLVAEWDLLSGLHKLKTKLKLQAKWVKAHQDENKDLEDLSSEAQLNCRANQLTNLQYRQRKPQDIHQSLPMPFVATQVEIREATITTHHHKSIRYHANQGPILTQLNNAHHLTTATATLLNRKRFEHINKNSQSATHSKWIFKCLPVHQTLHKRKVVPSPIFCRCRLAEQSDDHIILCSKSAQWQRDLNTFYTTTGQQHKLEASLMEMITKCLECTADGNIPNAADFDIK